MEGYKTGSSQEEREKQDAWKNRPVYSSPVRIANWNEDLFLQEEQFKVASYKREHCMLLVQKTRKMFKNLLTPVTLATESPFAIYGSPYQIKACDLSNKLTPETGPRANYGLYLSGLINEKDIEIGQHFMHGCGLSTSPDRNPCVRNTFIFTGCDGQSDGQSINYGEDVYIRICESGIEGDLFVQCENATYDDFGGHLKLYLTQSPDLYSRFKVQHWNPQLRMDTDGTGFAPNSRVIITHTASGKNLAAEYEQWVPTFFGAECVVSCHTFRDTHKMETAENMWMVVSDVRPDLNLYMRAAKGEDIPVDMLN